MIGNQLFQDILSYSLPLIGCPETSSNEDIHVATGVSKGLLVILPYWLSLGVESLHFRCLFFTEKYMTKLFGTSKDQMGVDQKAVLLVSKVNESKRHGKQWSTVFVTSGGVCRHLISCFVAVPPYTTCKGQRKWKPRSVVQSSFVPEEDNKDESALGNMGHGRNEAFNAQNCGRQTLIPYAVAGLLSLN